MQDWIADPELLLVWRLRRPPGHLLGYEHSFVHTIADFVAAVVSGKNAAPTFADCLATQRVLAAIEESARQHSWVRL